MKWVNLFIAVLSLNVRPFTSRQWHVTYISGHKIEKTVFQFRSIHGLQISVLLMQFWNDDIINGATLR